MIQKNFSKRVLMLWIVGLMMMFTVFGSVLASTVVDTVRPTIISVSPTNNEKDLTVITPITVVFSESMDPATINTDTFVVTQRTTPPYGAYHSRIIAGTVTTNAYTSTNDFTATFTPTDKLSPNQQYGNVFTVMITTGAKDLAGNSLSRDYLWSFTTGIYQFNTGTTTSQLDQSSIPIDEPTVVPIATTPVAPIVVPPVTNTQATTANWYTSIWIISGLIVLLLIIFLLAFSLMNPANKKYIVGSQASRPNPFGDVHPVMDLEGIGPKYSKRLHTMGIKNTKQLWNADAVNVANGTGASLSAVKSWQHMAELASVKDIGPQYAELLERSGVHTIGQLKSYDTDELLNMVRDKQDSLKIHIQGNTPGPALVENWITEARDHKFTEPEGLTA